MDFRRSFVSYAAALAGISVAAQLGIGLAAGSPLVFLFAPPVSYLIAITLISGSAWLIAPPASRGWWVLRYGASALLAGMLVTLLTVLVPAIDPARYVFRGEPRWMWDALLLVLFGALVWVFWMMFARPHLKRTRPPQAGESR